MSSHITGNYLLLINDNAQCGNNDYFTNITTSLTLYKKKKKKNRTIDGIQ